jgi:hypothetical protein
VSSSSNEPTRLSRSRLAAGGGDDADALIAISRSIISAPSSAAGHRRGFFERRAAGGDFQSSSALASPGRPPRPHPNYRRNFDPELIPLICCHIYVCLNQILGGCWGLSLRRFVPEHSMMMMTARREEASTCGGLGHTHTPIIILLQRPQPL